MTSLRDFERTAIDAVAAFSPWLAPAIPAYLTMHHAWRYLAQGTGWLDKVFVVVTALVVEFIGLAAVHTATELWRWNQERRASDDPAPFRLAMLAGAFYVAVVITVNVVLDATQSPAAVITAKALLSLLSVDAALVIAIRAQHARRLEDVERDLAEKKAERAERKAEKTRLKAETPEKPSEIVARPDRGQWVISHMAETGASRATAYRRYAQTFKTNGNGHHEN